MEEQTINQGEMNYQPTQPTNFSTSGPKRQAVPYMVAILALLVVLVGAIILFSKLNNPGAIVPVATNNTASTTAKSTMTATMTPTAASVPSDSAAAQSQLTTLQNQMNAFTNAENTSYNNVTSQINNSSSDQSQQTSVNSL